MSFESKKPCDCICGKHFKIPSERLLILYHLWFTFQSVHFQKGTASGVNSKVFSWPFYFGCVSCLHGFLNSTCAFSDFFVLLLFSVIQTFSKEKKVIYIKLLVLFCCRFSKSYARFTNIFFFHSHLSLYLYWKTTGLERNQVNRIVAHAKQK